MNPILSLSLDGGKPLLADRFYVSYSPRNCNQNLAERTFVTLRLQSRSALLPANRNSKIKNPVALRLQMLA